MDLNSFTNKDTKQLDENIVTNIGEKLMKAGGKIVNSNPAMGEKIGIVRGARRYLGNKVMDTGYGTAKAGEAIAKKSVELKTGLEKTGRDIGESVARFAIKNPKSTVGIAGATAGLPITQSAKTVYDYATKKKELKEHMELNINEFAVILNNMERKSAIRLLAECGFKYDGNELTEGQLTKIYQNATKILESAAPVAAKVGSSILRKIAKVVAGGTAATGAAAGGAALYDNPDNAKKFATKFAKSAVSGGKKAYKGISEKISEKTNKPGQLKESVEVESVDKNANNNQEETYNPIMEAIIASSLSAGLGAVTLRKKLYGLNEACGGGAKKAKKVKK